MTLIKSISGIRGTIGGVPGDNLTPVDILKYTSAFARWVKNISGNKQPLVVLGRDARISGPMLAQVVKGCLMGAGVNVLDLGMATTPTVELAVTAEKADAGMILTASHNPVEWNALKLLNHKGEFLSADDGEELLIEAENTSCSFPGVHDLGQLKKDLDYLVYHVNQVLALDTVDAVRIKNANLKVVVDGVNSIGGIALPAMLEALGVKVIRLNCEPTGVFAHNPEPLPENLKEISSLVVESKANMGMVVDPDVDRLAIINEDGSMFGEEYTLVAVADHILAGKKGPAVSNMSSSMALKDIVEAHGCEYFASEVGEVNVVREMKNRSAVIGGEGNGGIIFPELHYGRDALVGAALFLTHYVYTGLSCSGLKAKYPAYEMVKKKLNLPDGSIIDHLLCDVKKYYQNKEVDDRDGVKILFGKEWVHLRKSNTEPIIRVYAESSDAKRASDLAEEVMSVIRNQIS